MPLLALQFLVNWPALTPRRPLRDHALGRSGTGKAFDIYGTGPPNAFQRGHPLAATACCCGHGASPCPMAASKRYRYAASTCAKAATAACRHRTNWQGMEKFRAISSAACQQTFRAKLELLADVARALNGIRSRQAKADVLALWPGLATVQDRHSQGEISP